tara:strand:- start:787 stop:1188 length:402 start_codon:yes stop_codon:yes gene_type:complete
VNFNLRPITPIEEFEEACKKANLNNKEQKIIDHIRYVGVFTQPSLTKDLKLDSKPPVLSVLCEICRKIGTHMPNHFNSVRSWSKQINEHKVKWDGDLVCSLAWSKDGERLSPENGTCLYHTFAVHKELFQGLD